MSMACVRRATWGMLYTDNAVIVTNFAERFAKMMRVVVAIFEAAGLTVSEDTMETIFVRARDQTFPVSPLKFEAA